MQLEDQLEGAEPDVLTEASTETLVAQLDDDASESEETEEEEEEEEEEMDEVEAENEEISEENEG